MNNYLSNARIFDYNVWGHKIGWISYHLMCAVTVNTGTNWAPLEFYDSKFWPKKCSQHSFVPILQFLDWESSIIWNHFFLFKTDSGESLLLTNKSIKFQSFLIKIIFKTPDLENCKELENKLAPYDNGFWRHTFINCFHLFKIVSILYYFIP